MRNGGERERRHEEGETRDEGDREGKIEVIKETKKQQLEKEIGCEGGNRD